MRMLNKNSLTIISVALCISLIGGVVFYTWASSFLTDNIDKHLTEQYKKVRSGMLEGVTESQLSWLMAGGVELRKKPSVVTESTIVFDSIIVNSDLNTVSTYRIHKSCFLSNGEMWECLLKSNTFESYELIEAFVLIFLLLFILFSCVLFVVNSIFYRKVEDNFYQIKNALCDFSLGNKQAQVGECDCRCEIDEFESLNVECFKAIQKANIGYARQKEFAEDVAHELLSPVSICINKFETLIQDESLKENQAKGLYTIYSSMKRISRIIKSLNSITRFENDIFEGSRRVDLEGKLRNYLEEFEQSFLNKEIVVKYYMQKTEVTMNESLCDVMIGNLLQNALRYTDFQGKVIVSLQNDSLSVMNTSDRYSQIDKLQFSRYQRSNKSESIGVGLSLVKKICDGYGYELRHRCMSNLNIFKINF
jgi:signal transduction histidine kinase